MKKKGIFKEITTQENLGLRVSAGYGMVCKYDDHVLAVDCYWKGGFVAAIYEFVETPEATGLCECECRLRLCKTSDDVFADGGHAIAWAIETVRKCY